MASPDAPRNRLGLKRPLVVHPFLLAAFPILFLFAHNREEQVLLPDLLRPLELALGAVAIVMLVGWLIFRDPKPIGVLASAWVLLFFSYGHAADALAGKRLGSVSLGSDAVLLTAWSVLAVASGALAFAFRRRLAAVTKGLNAVALALVAMNIATIVISRPDGTGVASSESEVRSRVPRPAASSMKNLPDIYYIVPEDFGEEGVHRTRFGIDTSWFTRYLKSKGFYVASRSMANYQNTHQSLGSSLNLDYLHKLVGWQPKKESIYALLQNFEAARYLKSLGYRYVHIGSWYWPTAKDPAADVNLSSQTFSEFSETLYDTTVLPSIIEKIGISKTADRRRLKYERTLAEFDLLMRARHIPGPKFVFSHIMFPHYQGPRPPSHTFDRNGNYLTREQEERRSYKQLYGDQILFAAKKLKEVIDSLLSDPHHRPVIVLQTDEGVYPNEELEENPGPFLWREASRTVLKDHYRILNAYYLPAVPHSRLYPSITPVNTFRLIFDVYFHAGFPLLPDRYYARERNPYRLVDITRVLTG